MWCLCGTNHSLWQLAWYFMVYYCLVNSCRQNIFEGLLLLLFCHTDIMSTWKSKRNYHTAYPKFGPWISSNEQIVSFQAMWYFCMEQQPHHVPLCQLLPSTAKRLVLRGSRSVTFTPKERLNTTTQAATVSSGMFLVIFAKTNKSFKVTSNFR